MEFASYKPQWEEILKQQEEILRVEKMSAEDALALGVIMSGLAKEKYQKPIAIRIILGGHVAFSFLMDGNSMNNEWWMDKKLNTCRATGASSIRSLVELAEGIRPMESEFENEGDYALCGGCFPLRNAAGKLLGYVLSSGMPHECDHQLIVDALAEFLNVSVPSILE